MTTKDAVERFRKFGFRKFGFRLMTYAILGNGDFVYQFDATISTTRYNLFIRILAIEITWLYSSKAGRKIEFHTKNALYKKINWIPFLCLLNRCDPYEQGLLYIQSSKLFLANRHVIQVNVGSNNPSDLRQNPQNKLLELQAQNYRLLLFLSSFLKS